MVLDVVCGMEIDEATTKWKSEYKGKTYYFCGPMCKLEFDENPEKYTVPDLPKMNKLPNKAHLLLSLCSHNPLNKAFFRHAFT